MKQAVSSDDGSINRFMRRGSIGRVRHRVWFCVCSSPRPAAARTNPCTSNAQKYRKTHDMFLARCADRYAVIPREPNKKPGSKFVEKQLSNVIEFHVI